MEEKIIDNDWVELSDAEQPEIDLAKLHKIEQERNELLNRVVSGNIIDIKDRVAFILNNSSEARNSDNDLLWSYWETFEGEILKDGAVSREKMRNLTKQNSLIRIRAKIQNEYKLFQADPVVRKYRGMLEEDKKQEAIDDKPAGTGIYSVFIDETGKTQDFLSVGSLWLLDYGPSIITRTMDLKNWKKQHDINYEFHFTDANKGRLAQYKDFFTKFLSLFPEAGFKLIVINNKGFQDKNKAITDLTYHLISKGVDHEHTSGRAPLPRVLQVWIDEDEKGSDQLKLENIQERLTSQKTKHLYLGDFRAVDSSGNFFIQAVDLFASAVNRKLHFPNGDNFKDELAEFILTSVNFDISQVNKDNTATDNSTVFDLTF